MHKSMIALSILGATSAFAATNCAPEGPATCYADDCKHCYCLGPVNTMVNAPVNPRTCNGDWVITVAGLYWNAHQDGMEYAIDNHARSPELPLTTGDYIILVDAEYKTPNFDWNGGFKFGVGYNTTCDGWDFGVMWTWYEGSASSHIEAKIDDNHTLLPLWSAVALPNGGTIYARDIKTDWTLDLDLIDIELGREYWTSKYLTFRPFIGLRIAYIKQSFEIEHKGGSWMVKQQFFCKI
jgi:hypothetical protein